MKRKSLIILITILLLSILIVCGFIFYQMNNMHDTAEILFSYDTILDYISKNESKDENLKNFIAIKEISTISNKENVECYVLTLIDTYNIENQILQHKKSNLKIYKFIFKDTKIVSSNNLNIEDISNYNDYSVFPKEIIEKYLPLKDYVDLTSSIEKQIENFYNNENANEISGSNSMNELIEDYRIVYESSKNQTYPLNS